MNVSFYQRLISMTCGTILLSAISTPGNAVLVTRNMSGIWDLPDNERHGMTITVTQLANGDKSVVAYLATYDQSGQATWFASQGTVDGNTITGPLVRVTGPGFLDPAGVPSNVEQVGTLQIQFSDCNNGIANYNTPEEVVGTGGFRIARISNLFQETCTGGIVDDVPAGADITEFEIFLNNTGVDADASGKAEFEESAQRIEFKVEIENLTPGTYELFTDGEKRADIEVLQDDDATEAEVEFSSPVDGNDLLLDFDPRGMLLEIQQGGVVYLTSDLPAQGVPPGNDNGNAPPFGDMEIEIDLVNQGVYVDASGEAELEQRSDRVEFNVEIEDVPVGEYQLFVGGTERGSITVVETPDGTEGEIEFRVPPSSDELLLDFDPRGMLVSVEQSGIVILSADFPTMGDDDSDDDSDDDDSDGDSDDDSDDDNPDSVSIEASFINTGVISEAEGDVEYQDNSERIEFEVEAEDLPQGNYQLHVAGVMVASFDVDSEGEAELSFSDPVTDGDQALNFDPLGQTVSITDGAAIILTVDLPSI